ncbi:hypothetical protein D3C76_1464580 [compost metagenome]
MFNIVRSPISGKTHIQDIVKRHCSTVENGFAQFIVFWIFNQTRGRINNGTKNRLTESKLNRCIGIQMEIMFKHMRHHVYHAVYCLIQWYGVCVLRIKNGERWERILAEPCPFFLCVLIGYY